MTDVPDSDHESLNLDTTEVALIVGEEDGKLSVRIAVGRELAEGEEDIPEPHEIIAALATRLLKDPDFHEEMLDWYYEQAEDEDEEEATKAS